MTDLVQTTNILDWLVTSSFHAVILIGVILMVQTLLRKWLSANWLYLFWVLLLIRLLIPLPNSQISMFNYLSVPALESLVDPSPLSSEKVAGESAGRGIGAGMIAETATEKSARGDQPQESYGWRFWALAIWMFVALCLFIRTLWVHESTARHIRKLRPLVDKTTLELLEDCKSEMQVFIPLIIIETDRVQSPALLGFVRPRLLLPADMRRNLDRNEMRDVLLHELAHIRRRDVPANWVVNLLLVLHWFNPVLWFAFGRMRSDMEIACDEMVLHRRRKHETSSYGRTVIKILEMASKLSPLPGTIGLLEKKTFVKRRIDRIADRPTRFKYSAPLAVTGMLLIASFGLTNPATSDFATELLNRYRAAYERQDITALMRLFHPQAVFEEVTAEGRVLSRVRGEAIADQIRFRRDHNSQFRYRIVQAVEDTIVFTAAFRSGQFEVVGYSESEGMGRFELDDGVIKRATWTALPEFQEQRNHVFRKFVTWLKANRPADFERVFGSDLYIMHRAHGDEVNKLFFEWISETTQNTVGGFSMKDMPKVERITLDDEIHAVLKEFYGPYENAPEYVTEVQDYMASADLPYKDHHVLGIYFGDPQRDKPEELRSLQGVIVDQPQEVAEPYFNYSMKKTEYLHTRVGGNFQETIPAGYMALFNYMGLQKIQAGASGGHQVVTMENGQPVFDIYLEIDSE